MPGYFVDILVHTTRFAPICTRYEAMFVCKTPIRVRTAFVLIGLILGRTQYKMPNCVLFIDIQSIFCSCTVANGICTLNAQSDVIMTHAQSSYVGYKAQRIQARICSGIKFQITYPVLIQFRYCCSGKLKKTFVN